MRVPERMAGLVQDGQPGRPRHDEVDRAAGVEQRAQHRRRVRRAGGPGDADDPRCAHAPTVARAAYGYGRRPSRTTRSARANTNSAMPTNPLAVKKARFTRDRSVGRDDGVLVDERGRGQGEADPPQPAQADQRAEPHEQPERHHVHGDRQPQREPHAVAGRHATHADLPVDLGVLAGVDQVEPADPQPHRRRRAPRPARSRRACRSRRATRPPGRSAGPRPGSRAASR